VAGWSCDQASCRIGREEGPPRASRERNQAIEPLHSVSRNRKKGTTKKSNEAFRARKTFVCARSLSCSRSHPSFVLAPTIRARCPCPPFEARTPCRNITRTPRRNVALPSILAPWRRHIAGGTRMAQLPRRRF
jgi:hypothetical protein